MEIFKCVVILLGVVGLFLHNTLMYNTHKKFKEKAAHWPIHPRERIEIALFLTISWWGGNLAILITLGMLIYSVVVSSELVSV